MQPYFFPYLGYFQLLAHVDVFVVHDDTQYVKQSWINRNRILEHGVAAYLTLPVAGGSHRQLICDKRLHEPRRHSRKLLERIRRLPRRAASRLGVGVSGAALSGDDEPSRPSTFVSYARYSRCWGCAALVRPPSAPTRAAAPHRNGSSAFV